MNPTKNIKKGILFLKDAKRRTKFFGQKIVTFQLLAKFMPFFRVISHSEQKKIQNKVEELIKENLKNQIDFDNIYSKNKKKKIPLSANKRSKKVWMMWLQGEDAAPKIVQQCIEQARRVSEINHYEFNLITNNNINEYCDISEKVFAKYKGKIIGGAHFADYYRSLLLSQQGGLWLDATVFVVGPDLDKMFNYDFYSIKHSDDYRSVAHQRWSTSCLAANKENLLMTVVADTLDQYWQKNDYAIDYLLIDYIIAIFYDSHTDIRQSIDEIPENNNNYYVLEQLLNKKYNQGEYANLISDTYLFKTNYKDKISLNTDSFYSRIIAK